MFVALVGQQNDSNCLGSWERWMIRDSQLEIKFKFQGTSKQKTLAASDIVHWRFIECCQGTNHCLQSWLWNLPYFCFAWSHSHSMDFHLLGSNYRLQIQTFQLIKVYRFPSNYSGCFRFVRFAAVHSTCHKHKGRSRHLCKVLSVYIHLYFD